jgi:hypothetical protein
VTPGSLADPDQWRADLDAIGRFAAWHGSALGGPLVDEWFFWADGARRDPQLRLYRLGYGVVEPCLEIFAGWEAPGA